VPPVAAAGSLEVLPVAEELDDELQAASSTAMTGATAGIRMCLVNLICVPL
jgi:hypothetical protein